MEVCPLTDWDACVGSSGRRRERRKSLKENKSKSGKQREKSMTKERERNMKKKREIHDTVIDGYLDVEMSY